MGVAPPPTGPPAHVPSPIAAQPPPPQAPFPRRPAPPSDVPMTAAPRPAARPEPPRQLPSPPPNPLPEPRGRGSTRPEGVPARLLGRLGPLPPEAAVAMIPDDSPAKPNRPQSGGHTYAEPRIEMIMREPRNPRIVTVTTGGKRTAERVSIYEY